MTYEDRIKGMLVASVILQELEEYEQDAFMCASIVMLSDMRKMSPFDLMKQYVEAMVEVKFNEDKRK